jgi:hypothetical protein
VSSISRRKLYGKSLATRRCLAIRSNSRLSLGRILDRGQLSWPKLDELRIKENIIKVFLENRPGVRESFQADGFGRDPAEL